MNKTEDLCVDKCLFELEKRSEDENKCFENCLQKVL